MTGIFKADGDETGNAVSVSEWVLEPGSEGVHAHYHNDGLELFFVTEGMLRFLVGTNWVEAAAGTFLQIPPGTPHAFTNQTGERAAVLSFKIPGGFEREVSRWYARET